MFESLNEKQKKAVEKEGTTSILAGPGTGKTKTLVSKLVYLILKNKIDPSHILALTFTKKAAAEIKDRLKQFEIKKLPSIATFHALAYNILQDIYGTIVIDEQDKIHISSINTTFTFDELIVEAHKAILSHNPKTKLWNSRFSYVLIDEFQDTTPLQYEIAKTLVKKHIFVIGDPFQSIYSFRGADSSIFEKIRDDFPKLSAFTLRENYRSGTNIIKTAQKLFPRSDQLRSNRKSPGCVHHIIALNERSECDYVIRSIEEHMGGTDLIQTGNAVPLEKKNRFSDFAVLYRTHFYGKILEARFSNANIPYQIVGGGSIFEKPHIESVINWIHRPKSQHTYNKPSDMIGVAIEELDLEGKLKKSAQKQKELQQFIGFMAQFDQYRDGHKKMIEYLQYLKDHEFYDERADKVTLLTMHAAKGLEFEHVYIVGFEDTIIPFVRRKKANQQEIEEEKRLLYVAMTRARESLTLIRPVYRFGKKTIPSRFLSLMSNSPLLLYKDEAMETQKARYRRWVDKKNQMKLF